MNHFSAFHAACAFFLLLSTSMMHAQCDSDFDFGELEFGVSPDPALEESFIDGMLGEPYLDVLHILIPANAAGIDDTYPPTLPVDSVIVADDVVNGENDYSGVVFVDIATEETFFAEEIGLSLSYNNNGDSPNASTFLGANQYCAVIQGVPTRSGQYRIDIDIIAWATIFTPFNVPYTFEDFTLRVNCPVLEGVEVQNTNSLDGTQGQLSANLLDGIAATEIAWFNSGGAQIGVGDSVLVDNPGTFSVQITTEDCVSLFGDFIVIDEGVDCGMEVSVELIGTDPGLSNGSATLVVVDASGEWTANWYGETGLLIGTGESIVGLDEGLYSVVVVDDIGCAVEVAELNLVTGLAENDGLDLTVFPNPVQNQLNLAGDVPAGSSWTLWSLSGQIVAQGAWLQGSVDVSHIAKGIYVFDVAISGAHSLHRVVLSH